MSVEAHRGESKDAGYEPRGSFDPPKLWAAHIGLTPEQFAAQKRFTELLDDLPEPVSCRYSPDMWFSNSTDDRDYAKMHCARCPVMYDCREYADILNVKVGIWGGESRTSKTPHRGKAQREDTA